MWSQKEGMSGIKHFYWVPLYGTIMFQYIHQIPVTSTKAINVLTKKNIYLQ